MEPEAGPGPSDEDLMARLKAGDEAALAPLMQRWELPVKRFIFRIVGSSAEADDLAQDVFVRVFTKRRTYREGAKFSTWCFSIAANQAKNRLRWWSHRPTVSLSSWTELGGDSADETRAGQSASRASLRAERIGEIQAAVAELPFDLRTALVLFEYEGQSMSEVAASLGCTAKAVENRLYRARKQLRLALSLEE